MSMDGEPQITVTKVTGYLQVSNEILMDMGLIPDTRPPPPPIPWRRRLHYRLDDLRDWLAAHAYKTIAGHEPYGSDDY